jgi:hypothetical protein
MEKIEKTETLRYKKNSCQPAPAFFAAGFVGELKENTKRLPL